jgi:hypothetical protein
MVPAGPNPPLQGTSGTSCTAGRALQGAAPLSTVLHCTALSSDQSGSHQTEYIPHGMHTHNATMLPATYSLG